MDLKSYAGIVLAACIVPAIMVIIVVIIISKYYENFLENLMPIIMKGTISKRNIDKKPTYLVCNRYLPPHSRKYFIFYSFAIIFMCVQLFFLLAIVDVSYDCVHRPDIDCFKKKDDVKLTDTFAYNESPVNCSSISRDDFVICYRVTFLDPQRAFIAAAAAYLLFKMLNFAFLVVSKVMLWITMKLEGMKLMLFRLGFSLFLTILVLVPLTLKVFLDEVESAFRKLSYTAVIQFLIVFLSIIFYLLRIPWEKFGKSDEYLIDASLPINEGDSEMAVRKSELCKDWDDN